MTFLDFFSDNEGWVPHCPDFLWRLVALIHSMHLSLKAQACVPILGWSLWCTRKPSGRLKVASRSTDDGNVILINQQTPEAGLH